jgi:beta-glucosidase
VQLYIRDQVSSVTRPIKELRGFARVTLQPGDSRVVSFTLGPAELSLIDRRMQRVVEPGRFEIMVGTSATPTPALTATLDVVAR